MFIVEIVRVFGRKHPWKTSTGQGPSHHWWKKFLARHPEVCVYKPSGKKVERERNDTRILYRFHKFMDLLKESRAGN